MLPEVLNREQSRKVDEFAINELGIPGIVLMENAGRGCAKTLIEFGADATLICCGPGNNGGDGFVIARHLAIQNIPSKILVFASLESIEGDALTNLKIAQALHLPLVFAPDHFSDEWLDGEMSQVGGKPVTWIVDALLGTGARGAVRAPMDRVVEAINESAAKRISIDIPTGLDCDTGLIENVSVQADVTCTFVSQKPGFLVEEALRTTGEIRVINIGIPESLIVDAARQ